MSHGWMNRHCLHFYSNTVLHVAHPTFTTRVGCLVTIVEIVNVAFPNVSPSMALEMLISVICYLMEFYGEV